MKNDFQFTFLAVAVRLLDKHKFSIALNTLIKAQDFYSIEDYQKSLTNALLAIDNTMQSICMNKKWINTVGSRSKLINIICNSKLIPGYLQNQYTSLVNILRIDPLSLRHKDHYKTSDDIPEYFTAFALQSTIASIIFLIRAYEDTEKLDLVKK